MVVLAANPKSKPSSASLSDKKNKTRVVIFSNTGLLISAANIARFVKVVAETFNFKKTLKLVKSIIFCNMLIK